MRQPEEKNFSSDVGSEGVPTDTFHIPPCYYYYILRGSSIWPGGQMRRLVSFQDIQTVYSEILGQIFL